MKEYWGEGGRLGLQIQCQDSLNLGPILLLVWQEYLEGLHLQSLSSWFEQAPNQKLVISLSVLNGAEMRQLNLIHRNRDYPTDVLSFPTEDNLWSQSRPVALLPEHSLGDIIICAAVARRQAKEFGITYKEEFIHLAHHGFLHLLGLDHERSLEEQQKMLNEEQILLDLTTLMRGFS